MRSHAIDTMNEQVDATYTHNIEKLVRKVCMLSQEPGETHEKHCLKASSLQCLSAMVISAPFELLCFSPLSAYYFQCLFSVKFYGVASL